MSRARFTEFMVLVDTHYAPKTPEEEKALGDDLLAAVREFCSVAVLRRVLLCDDVSKLRKKQLTGASVEIGEKYHRLHVHFVLNLEHQTTVYLKHPDGRTINKQCQEWFNERLGTNCFVSVALADTRAKNYATKGRKGVASATANRVSISREEIENENGRTTGGATSSDRS